MPHHTLARGIEIERKSLKIENKGLTLWLEGVILISVSKR